MARSAKFGDTDSKSQRGRDDSRYGIEYHGVPGSSRECQDAVTRLLQCGMPLVRARIISSPASHHVIHCLLLTSAFGELIAVKSGFTSGYRGTGPSCFSFTLQLLHSHKVEIDEYVVDVSLIDRLDRSALSVADIKKLSTSRAFRPHRWFEYVQDRHEQQAQSGTLWQWCPPVIPFSVIDARIIDLARTFWDDPDGKLLRGYRRLEDLVRKRTGLTESSAKLFSRVFTGKDAFLTWEVTNESEKAGRASLFTATYMAYRNPRAHKESPTTELLAEFLLLNQLYHLERQSVRINQ